MRILVGTKHGLFAVEDGGPKLLGLQGEVTSIDPGASVVLVDGRLLFALSSAMADGPIGGIGDGPVGRCVLAAGDGFLVGTAEAGLVRVSADGDPRPVHSFDSVPERSAWYTPWGGPPDTRSLALGADGAIHAGVHVGGIPRSRDGGETWEPTIDVDADVHQVVTDPSSPNRVLAATAYGLAVSEDGGDTWNTRSDGLETGRYQRAVAVAGEWAVVSSSEGHVGRRSAIYRTPIGAERPFEPCPGLPAFDSNVDSGWLAARGETVAFAGPDGTVWRSEDSGATWELAAEDLREPRAVALTEERGPVRDPA